VLRLADRETVQGAVSRVAVQTGLGGDLRQDRTDRLDRGNRGDGRVDGRLDLRKRLEVVPRSLEGLAVGDVLGDVLPVLLAVGRIPRDTLVEDLLELLDLKLAGLPRVAVRSPYTLPGGVRNPQSWSSLIQTGV
jgi:hypothetical protein